MEAGRKTTRIQNWQQIDWREAIEEVERIQEKITIAALEGRKKDVYKLQKTLIRSFSARALAVRKVISNKGGKTAGVDRILWKTPQMYFKGVQQLLSIVTNPNEYRAKPLRRVEIPRPGSSIKRSLGIPTITDRTVQALYQLAVDPAVEAESDKNSFGFRKGRSTHDAINTVRSHLDKKTSPRWVMKIDISKCFDRISHDFLLKWTPIRDKVVLEQWLKSGVMIRSKYQETEEGTPQGGVISPVLSNVALNGIEGEVKKEWPKKKGISAGVHLVRYADDIIVTAKSKQILTKIKQTIEKFLALRGLQINQDKTIITNILKGVEFLGFWIQRRPYNPRLNKYNGQDTVLIVEPSPKGIKKLKDKILRLTQKTWPIGKIIAELNPVLRGWAEHKRISYHSQPVFIKLDHFLWTRMMKWAQRTYTGPRRRTIDRWTMSTDARRWIWGTKSNNKTILRMAEIPTIKLPLLKLDRNPYLLSNKEYYTDRKKGLITAKFRAVLYRKQRNLCPVCGGSLFNGEMVEIHHLKPQREGGKYNLENCQALHMICHKKVTHLV